MGLRQLSLPVLALAILGAAGGARAQDICASVVNGEALRFDRETFLENRDGVTRRERLLTWPGRQWDGLRGREPECDSQTLIRYLSLTIPADQIDGYCLSEVDDLGHLLIPGERNFRGRCTGTVCEVVNTSAEAAVNVTGTAARAVAEQTLNREGGVGGLLHTSGAAILTGQATTISSTLGSIGTAMGAALSTPAVLAATAVTVVAVGGAVYVCRD